MKLSIALATYNEEVNIKRCLESIKDIADEIVIVDGGSSDNTVSIAKEFHATIINTNNPSIFHINKQKALDACGGEWVLNLDADEVVSQDLAREIEQVLNGSWMGVTNNSKKRLFHKHQSNLENNVNTIKTRHETANTPSDSNLTNGFYLPRLNIFLGQPLHYGGVYPDGVIRLVKNGQAHYPCKSVHEQIEVNGRVKWLENDLLHYDSPTFKRYISRANRYTDLTAKDLYAKRTAISFRNDIFYLLLKSLVVFVKIYFRHKGFLDGFAGFIWALFSALHWPLAYMKLADLYREKQ